MSICESPSNITWSKPVSRANSRALLAAIASTSMAVKGSVVFCERETMTCPISFRITTPIPALYSYANRAPSKFTLYVSLSGGCQQVGGRPTGIMVEELWRLNSRNLSCLRQQLAKRYCRFSKSNIISPIPYCPNCHGEESGVPVFCIHN